MSLEFIKCWLELKWNFNNVVCVSGEKLLLLGVLKDDVAGVTTLFLEVGSTFSFMIWC